jgi:6-pyruvoyltetrahydropterin/6-carboxytetrahydropterin synthase
VLDVTVRGPVDERSGRAVDPAELDRLVRVQVLCEFDHKNLNEQVAAFQDSVPTTENLGLLIHKRLQQAWPDMFPGPWPRLEKVRIAETERNIFVVDANNES